MNHETVRSGLRVPPRRSKALLWVVLGGLCAICVAAIYLHFTYNHSMGEGPAGPPVPRDPFSRPWSNRAVHLVGFGDSVTAGFGARRGYSYFDRLFTNPPDEFEEMKGICLSSVFPHLRISNFAISGSVSRDLLETQLPRLKTAESNVLGWVVITTGGNDLIHNYGKTAASEHAMYGATWDAAQPWIANFEKRLEAIITGIEQQFPGGCHIFLANIYDPSDGVGDIEKAGLPRWPDGARIHAAYNEVIRNTAERHSAVVHMVDMRQAFLGHGIHCAQFWARHYDGHDPHYWYFTNLEDPNERGYDAIRRLFLNEMAKVSQRLK